MATYPAKIYSFYYSESGGGMDTGGQIAAFDEKELMCISFFFFLSATEHSTVADQYLLDKLGIEQSRYLVIYCVLRFYGASF